MELALWYRTSCNSQDKWQPWIYYYRHYNYLTYPCKLAQQIWRDLFTGLPRTDLQCSAKMKGQISLGSDGEFCGCHVEGKNPQNNQESLFLFHKHNRSGFCPSLVYSAHSLEGQGPSVLPRPSFRRKNPAFFTTQSNVFLFFNWKQGLDFTS